MALRGWIYDVALLGLTAGWYGQVLARVDPRSRLLDIGIGTGGALARHAATVRAKELRVVGLDIDAAYVARARRAMARAGLADHVQVRLESVAAHRGGPYDAAYFSASFMLLPDPVAVLRHLATQLEPDATVYFTQTFHERRAPTAERLKPLLGRLTTIEFGRVTYEGDFRAAVAAGGFDLLDLVTMGRNGARAYRLGVARPGGRDG